MEAAVHINPAESLESVLRGELASGDAVIGSVSPILRHLLDNGDNSLFGDDIVASIRGMAADIARQLLDELARAAGETDPVERDADEIHALINSFIDNPEFLHHLHALALEWQLTQRLQTRLAIDPVLPPLLQSLMASPDQATSGLAMNLLAAQARYCQSQRRMQIPIHELPGDLLHGVLLAMSTIAGPDNAMQAAVAEQAIRSHYDESRSRLGIMARLAIIMGGGLGEALSVNHSGVALFLSALTIATGQSRDIVALSTNESQLARLALSLRSAGLKSQILEMQFLTLHPDIALPDGFDQISSDRAAALLATTGLANGA